MPTIAIYARKSKFSQRSESVATQITLCREHCERLFPGAEYIIYDSDEGYSGKNTNRPGFQRLMDDIKSRKVQVVCVYRLDRISRSVSDFCQLLDTFQRYHTSFVSLRENFDTTTPMGRAMLGIIISSKQPLFLSIPAFDVLNNIFQCPFLSENEQLLLGRAFYRAYHAHMEGRTQPLDEKLGNMLGKLI